MDKLTEREKCYITWQIRNIVKQSEKKVGKEMNLNKNENVNKISICMKKKQSEVFFQIENY